MKKSNSKTRPRVGLFSQYTLQRLLEKGEDAKDLFEIEPD
jgi:hypothetical protein